VEQRLAKDLEVLMKNGKEENIKNPLGKSGFFML
jgi:hypothetical protein